MTCHHCSKSRNLGGRDVRIHQNPWCKRLSGSKSQQQSQNDETKQQSQNDETKYIRCIIFIFFYFFSKKKKLLMKKNSIFFIRNSKNCKNLDFKYVCFITLGALEASQKRFHQVSSYTKPTVLLVRTLQLLLFVCSKPESSMGGLSSTNQVLIFFFGWPEAGKKKLL